MGSLTVSLSSTDDGRHGGGGEDSILSDEDFGHSITGGDLEDELKGLSVIEPSISTDNEKRSLELLSGKRVEDRLNEVGEVVSLSVRT